MVETKKTQVPKRVARNSLTQSGILDAALTLVKRKEQITIRSVALVLECTPMAIYRHFSDKEKMMLALLDRVLSSVSLERKHASAEMQLKFLAHAHLKSLQANGWAIPLLFEHPDPGPAAAKIGEEFLSLLKESGVEGELAVRTFTSILALNYGWAGFTASSSSSAMAAPLARNLKESSPDPREYPNTAKQWKRITKAGNDTDYLAVLDSQTSGIWTR